MTEPRKLNIDETMRELERIAAERGYPSADFAARVAEKLSAMGKNPSQPAPREQIVEYDPATCITAGELRAVGVPVPDNIPDCGWVPRWAWTFKAEPAEHQAAQSPDVISMEVSHRFSEPFRWVDVKALVEKAAP